MIRSLQYKEDDPRNAHFQKKISAGHNLLFLVSLQSSRMALLFISSLTLLSINKYSTQYHRFFSAISASDIAPKGASLLTARVIY